LNWLKWRWLARRLRRRTARLPVGSSACPSHANIFAVAA
jgi:hypothetical protein